MHIYIRKPFLSKAYNKVTYYFILKHFQNLLDTVKLPLSAKQNIFKINKTQAHI